MSYASTSTASSTATLDSPAASTGSASAAGRGASTQASTPSGTSQTAIERPDCRFALDAIQTATPERGFWFKGRASAFLNVNADMSILEPGAMQETLPFFLKNGFIAGMNHNWSQMIGAPIAAHEEGRHLVFEAELMPEDLIPEVARVKALMSHKLSNGRSVLTALSIGFDTVRSTRMKKRADVEAFWAKHGYAPTAQDLSRVEWATTPQKTWWGEKITLGIRVHHQIKLYEVSPVTAGANDQAEITETQSRERLLATRPDPNQPPVNWLQAALLDDLAFARETDQLRLELELQMALASLGGDRPCR